MVDYTWVADLLREIEDFAVDTELTGLSENLALACAALISDTEEKATIRPDARQWLEKVGARTVVPGRIDAGKVVALRRC
jgi:hypothetical protein